MNTAYKVGETFCQKDFNVASLCCTRCIVFKSHVCFVDFYNLYNGDAKGLERRAIYYDKSVAISESIMYEMLLLCVLLFRIP